MESNRELIGLGVSARTFTTRTPGETLDQRAYKYKLTRAKINFQRSIYTEVGQFTCDNTVIFMFYLIFVCIFFKLMKSFKNVSLVKFV